MAGTHVRKHVCQYEAFYETGKSKPNLDIFKRILKRIRKFTTISSHHPDTKLLFRSTELKKAEEHRHTKTKLWFSIHPCSGFNYYWRIAICFVYVLAVAADLLDATIVVTSEENWTKQFVKYTTAINVLYLLDVFVNFLTGYVAVITKGGTATFTGPYNTREIQVVLERGKVAKHYIKTYFIFDLICLMNLIVYTFHDYWDVKEPDFCYLLTFVRLFRHVRFITVFRNIKMALSVYGNPEEIYDIFCILFSFFYLQFFFSCIHILVPAMLFHIKKSKTRHFSEKIIEFYAYSGYSVNDLILYVYSNFISCYSIVGAHALLGTNNIDIIIYFTDIFSGYIFRVFFFIKVLKMLHNRYGSWLKFLELYKDVSIFEGTKNMDKNSMQLMLSYLKNTLNYEFCDENTIMGTLPPHLRYEIFEQSSMNLIRTCHLFHNLPPDMLYELASRLKHETYDKGITIVELGELATCMYFLAAGTVAVYGRRQREICHLSDGNYFGEIGLIKDISVRRVATVVCVENCSMYRLDVKDFHDVIKQDSEIHNRIKIKSMRRMADRRRSSGVWATASSIASVSDQVLQ